LFLLPHCVVQRGATIGSQAKTVKRNLSFPARSVKG